MTANSPESPPFPTAGGGPRADREAALAALDAHLAGAGYGPSTRVQYGRIAIRFLRWLERRGSGLALVTPPEVERFLTTLKTRLSEGNYRTALRHFFDALVARGVLTANPVGGKSHVLTRSRTRRPRLGKAPSLAYQFAASTAVERQATVGAAATALLVHDIYAFTEGRGGSELSAASADLCEEALQLGERYGITPFSWVDEPPDGGVQDRQEVGTAGETYD